ncbi:MAG: NADPH-dependent FMN reductase [Burkholderiaceae bacterium]
MSLELHVIVCSTRPGRIGPPIAHWFSRFAAEHGKFNVKLVDLADFNLPVFDEPNHPRLQKYEHDHTKAWSASVNQADAFVFVTPEYNYCPPPSLINALNYLSREWAYKPCGFVSYGGVSGGLRSAQQAKQLVTTLKMMPMPEGVAVPMAWDNLDEQKTFTATDPVRSSAAVMLDELHKWAGALKTLR